MMLQCNNQLEVINDTCLISIFARSGEFAPHGELGELTRANPEGVTRFSAHAITAFLVMQYLAMWP